MAGYRLCVKAASFCLKSESSLINSGANCLGLYLHSRNKLVKLSVVNRSFSTLSCVHVKPLWRMNEKRSK